MTGGEDKCYRMSEEALQAANDGLVQGKFLAEWLPFLKYIPTWFPGASFKRKALEWRQMNRAMLNLPFEMVKQRMVSWLVPETLGYSPRYITDGRHCCPMLCNHRAGAVVLLWWGRRAGETYQGRGSYRLCW